MHSKQAGGVRSGLLSGFDQPHNFLLLTKPELRPPAADTSFLASCLRAMAGPFTQHLSFEFRK
jgi:hypothetical protein